MHTNDPYRINFKEPGTCWPKPARTWFRKQAHLRVQEENKAENLEKLSIIKLCHENIDLAIEED